MAKTRRLIQTRPSTSVDFYTPDTASLNKITEYVNAGKTSGMETTLSEDSLTQTLSLTFNTDEDYNNFKLEDVIITASANRIAHCQNNSIAFSVEEI